MEDEFIAASGTDVTDAFRLYLRPLLGSGMPDAYRLRRSAGGQGAQGQALKRRRLHRLHAALRAWVACDATNSQRPSCAPAQGCTCRRSALGSARPPALPAAPW